MMPIIAIRPEPGLSATIELAHEAGLAVNGFALFDALPVAWDLPDPNDWDGLLVGSANVFRHGGENLGRLRHLPVIAVGEATAQAARSQGFSVEKVGEGGLQSLLETLANSPRRLLRLMGEDHVALDPPAHVEIVARECYRIAYHPLPDGLVKMLRDQSLVLLHSAGAARHFAAECDRLSVGRETVSLAALGPRILAAAGSGWARAESASNPSDAALLALARDMCH